MKSGVKERSGTARDKSNFFSALKKSKTARTFSRAVPHAAIKN